MGTLMCMLGQTVGFPVPEGGAGRLSAALADRFTTLGGESVFECRRPDPGRARPGDGCARRRDGLRCGLGTRWWPM